MEYEELHELRLQYALGMCDERGDKKLDANQITELSVLIGMELETRRQMLSLKTKFPMIGWEQYTKESFLKAIETACDAEPGFVNEMQRMMCMVPNEDEWAAFARKIYDNRAVGLFLKMAVQHGVDVAVPKPPPAPAAKEWTPRWEVEY